MKIKPEDSDEEEFGFDKILVQNVITVEDDRPEIPVLSVSYGKNSENTMSLIFAILRFKKVKAYTSLRLQKEEFLGNLNEKSHAKNPDIYLQNF